MTPPQQAVAEKTFSELVLNKIGLNLYSGKFQSHFSHFYHLTDSVNE